MKQFLVRVCGSSAAPKKHLIEAASFGRLNRMLRTPEQRRKKRHLNEAGLVLPPRSNAKDDIIIDIQGGSGGALSPCQKPDGLGGSAHQPKPKNNEHFSKQFENNPKKRNKDLNNKFYHSFWGAFNRKNCRWSLVDCNSWCTQGLQGWPCWWRRCCLRKVGDENDSRRQTTMSEN